MINQPPEALIQWFVEQLKKEPPLPDSDNLAEAFYSGHTAYDQRFYRLQKEAERRWRLLYGEAPSHGHLLNAYFQAEHFLSREQRLQPWWKKIQALWLSQKPQR